MAAGKSDRKNNSEYKIFEGNLRDNDAVRVGYIDKKEGIYQDSLFLRQTSMPRKILALLSSLRIEKRLDI